jgi:hypothetical protein
MARRSNAEQAACFRRLLEGDDDIALFSEGGCWVFALALHDRFRYDLAWIPGHPDDVVDGILPASHVFAVLNTEGQYGVDVRGTRTVKAVRDAFGGIEVLKLSMDELNQWRTDPRHGLFPEQWFLNGAMVRALSRIARFRPYFDGTKKMMVP